MNYKPGVWNVTCAVCGFDKKSDEVKQRWDGVWVCAQDWEPRHIRDFFTAPPPERQIPWTQQTTEETVTGYQLVEDADLTLTGVYYIQLATTTRTVDVDLTSAITGEVRIILQEGTAYGEEQPTIRVHRSDSNTNSTVKLWPTGSDTINGAVAGITVMEDRDITVSYLQPLQWRTV